MSESRVNAKGRVTIPPKLRERYGLRPGTPVEIVAGADGVLIRPRREAPAGTNGTYTSGALALLTRWEPAAADAGE
jgi:AbrB family looped-hinge helix DNA binding protein